MAEPLRPAATKAYGRDNWLFVPAVADITAPTVAEVNAASGLDITNIVFADGAPAPSQNTNLVSQERRFGDTTTTQFVGTTTYAGGEVTYAFNQQGASGDNTVKLWEKISAGTTGFLIRRTGIAKATAPAAGQFVDVYPVEFGPSMPGKTGDAEASEGSAMCSFAITSAPAFKKAIAA